MKGFLNLIFIIGLMLIVTFGFILAQEPCYEAECVDQAWDYCEEYCQDHWGCDEVIAVYTNCNGNNCGMQFWIFCQEAPWWGKCWTSCYSYMCQYGQ